MLAVFSKHACGIWCDLDPLHEITETGNLWKVLAVNVVSGLCRWIIIYSFMKMSLFSVSFTLQRCFRPCFPIMNPQIHVFYLWLVSQECSNAAVTGLILTLLSLHILESFSATLNLSAGDWKLGLLNRREPSGICSFHILFVWAGTSFVVLTLGRIKDFSAKPNCIFFLRFIAVACVFQLVQLYGLGTKAMRQIHVLVRERRRKCCFRTQKASVANFKLPSIWQTINRQ